MPIALYSPHDPRFYDRRLHTGGDGGAGEMRRMEVERQRKVQAAVDAINAKFGAFSGQAPERSQFSGVLGQRNYETALADFTARQSESEAAKAARGAQYGDISGAVRDTAMRDLDRQYSTASRRNTFGLARAGMLGGSVDAESGGELATLYGEGKLRAEQAGQGAASELRSTDERTRQNLISLAQSGIDTGTAASMAAGQMGAAADLARSQAGSASVGRLFDDLSQAYLTNQVMRARYPNGLPQQSSSYGTTAFAPSRYTGTLGN